MKNWVEYYDSDHSIYVNARHRDVHYARLAEAFARHVPPGAASVLDYGCGEALHAARVAAVAGKLILAEAGPAVRGRLTARFRGNPGIVVISTDEVAALPRGSLDMVILHSVSQYLSRAEFARIAAVFHGLLQSNGLLLVGDVVPPAASVVADTLALLRFGWQAGFFVAAAAGLVRTFFSDYRRLRSRMGLTRYSEQEMAAVLAASGFMVTRAPVNAGHLATRMTFLARKTGAGDNPLPNPPSA
ncbi:MAG: methyltransferase domain-containing protein [Bradyrhizobiaceae bacterium]|nr:methyltransferase domain-containing protein [Bradyrhizobiaceae bacterium]